MNVRADLFGTVASHRPAVLLVGMVLIRMAAFLLLLKVLAHSFGADGFGPISQVIAITALFAVLAGGGVMNGIIRNVAAAQDDEERTAWIRAALPVAAVVGLALGVFAVVLHLFARDHIFPGSLDVGPVLLFIAAAQFVVGFGNVALAWLSGTGRTGAFALAQAGGAVLASVAIAALALRQDMAAVAAACTLIALFPAGIAMVLAGSDVPWSAFWRSFDGKRIRIMLRFGLTMVVAVVAVPSAWIWIRADLAVAAGWEQVGLWQSVQRLSEAYMQIFGALFVNHGLPRMARAGAADWRSGLRETAVLVAVLFAAGAVVLLSFDELVLRLAFNAEFVGASVFVGPQLLGDGLKLASLCCVYALVSLNRPGAHALTEVVQAIVLVTVYTVLLEAEGSLAPVQAYIVSAAATLLLAAFFLWRAAARTAAVPAAKVET